MSNASAQKAAEKCRAVAAVLDGLDVPGGVNVIIGQGPDISLFCHDIEDVRDLRRQVGAMNKRETGAGGGFLLRGSIDGVGVDVWPPSSACQRVEVGTEQRAVIEVPDEVAAEYTRTETVPVYEWECDPVLADTDANGRPVPVVGGMS
jgi:hypothetical protein